MYCKKCGKEIPNDSAYCNHCGTRQTPKKIVVEFNEPSLPSIDGDDIRSGIFRLGRFLKKSIISLKPLALSFLIIALITGTTYGIVYGSYYLLNIPPEANLAEIELYSEKGIALAIEPTEGTWSEGLHKYRNPSEILLNCKWNLDDDMINNIHLYSLGGGYLNINEIRKGFLNYRSNELASSFSLVAFVICLLYYFIRLFVRFRKWFYKK